MNKLLKVLVVFIMFLSFYSFKKSIFKRSKKYFYETVYIQPNGDTLAQEKINWNPKGLPWLLQMRYQTAITFNYYPDSSKTKDILLPITKRNLWRENLIEEYKIKGKEWKGKWAVKDYVGAIENIDEVWIHPIRNDHFIYTEIAPFPCVEKRKLIKDSTWTDNMWFGSGYDEFSGTSINVYTVDGQKKYEYKTMKLDSCWQINAVSTHSKKGENYHNFLFHPEHGFIEMKYEFYDGTRIEFYMVEIEDKKNNSR